MKRLTGTIIINFLFPDEIDIGEVLPKDSPNSPTNHEILAIANMILKHSGNIENFNYNISTMIVPNDSIVSLDLDNFKDDNGIRK